MDEGTEGAYVDRESGELCTEHVHQSGLFRWLYASRTGRAVRRWLTGSGLLHRAVGRFADSRPSRLCIRRFSTVTGVDTSEVLKPEGGFHSFNEFFARRLRPQCRPLDADPEALVSPGDGKLFVSGDLGSGGRITVKGCSFTAAELLAGAADPTPYAGGSAAVLRLYLPDYHRIHFPADGVPGQDREIPGRYLSVTPFRGNDEPFYFRNHRVVSVLDSPRFGPLAMVEIGGFLISSVRPLCAPGQPVRRGDEKSL
ncbi:MAG: phosphatidylserine decarboxylase, partial [Planctomycetota bacterium]|nr:phosphatidylserine decarboxylase [Planctomycetota bacterium]